MQFYPNRIFILINSHQYFLSSSLIFQTQGNRIFNSILTVFIDPSFPIYILSCFIVCSIFPKTDIHENFKNCIHPFQSLVQIKLLPNSLSLLIILIKINSSFAANITDLSLDEILEAIFQLGDLYDSEFMMQNTYEIDQLLTIFYNGSYSITELMKRVSPILYITRD